MKPFKIARILVPVDFSARSRPAVEYAIALAQPHGAHVDALHVWEPPRFAGRGIKVAIPGETRESLTDYFHGQATKAMMSFIEEIVPPSNVTLEGQLECGRAASSILEVAEKGDYDLLVVATSGRSGLRHFFVGSVAENLVRLSPIPVLTLRVPDEEGGFGGAPASS
jgi:nucleotide-binding universal stress UspA family protein